MIIGLTGRKGVGKDTVAKYLIDRYGFIRLSFADPLKQAVANLFGIELALVEALKAEDKVAETTGHVILEIAGRTQYDYSWREFLQRFGTEMGRNTFGEDFWIERWQDEYDALKAEHVVATDVRFDNEARRILSEGGYIIEITRPGYESDGHVSEAGIDEDLIDAWITNNGSLDDLLSKTHEMIGDIIHGRVARFGVSDRN